MKKLILSLVMVAMGLGATGCGSRIDTKITEWPATYDIETSRTFNAPYDKVWKATVDSIGQSFFVLENIEKDSGIMSISFSSKTPSDYIDCGTVTDSGKINGKDYSFSFEAASSPVTRWVTGNGSLAIQCLRTASLSGKSNVLVQKFSKDTTRVKITTRYVFTLDYTCQFPYDAGGFTPAYRTEKISDSMSFVADELGTFDKADSIQCRSKKTLESWILDEIGKLL